MEFIVSHKCVCCKRKIPAEKEAIRLAPSDLTNEDLVRMPSRHLGLWIHRKCYSKYFAQFVNTLDKQHAVK